MGEDYPHEEPGDDAHERAVFWHDPHKCRDCHKEYQPRNRIEARRNRCTPCHTDRLNKPPLRVRQARAREEKRINHEAEMQLRKIEREQVRAAKALEKARLKDLAKVEKARARQLSKLDPPKPKEA